MAEQETQPSAPATPAAAPAPTESAPSKPVGFDAAAAKAQWMEKWKSTPAEEKPAEKPAEPEAKPAPTTEDAPDKPKTAVKDLAAKLAGKPDAAPKKAGSWDETATKALSRIGLREQEAAELSELLAEKPWVTGWLDKLQKVQAKQDADYAALKSAKAGAGTREPTPGARGPSAQEQGDQPGSGQVADLFETLTSKLGEELGDENAKLLRQAFGQLEAQNRELREELHGHTRSVQVEREAAEIEVIVQKSRASLREEFPWIDDDERFEAVATELAGLRPDEVTPDGVKAAMRKAARIVGYDDVRADVAAMASKLDTKRKTRTSDTAPNGNGVHDAGQPLNDYQEFMETARMVRAGMSQEQVQSFVLNNRQRRARAT